MKIPENHKFDCWLLVTSLHRVRAFDKTHQLTYIFHIYICVLNFEYIYIYFSYIYIVCWILLIFVNITIMINLCIWINYIHIYNIWKVNFPVNDFKGKSKHILICQQGLSDLICKILKMMYFLELFLLENLRSPIHIVNFIIKEFRASLEHLHTCTDTIIFYLNIFHRAFFTPL